MADNKYVLEAQKRGINLSEDADGGWHGSFIYDGQEYTLDADTIEDLSSDMTALADILESDSYTVDYNDDLDRYLVSVVGFEEPFSNQSLSVAFGMAKHALDLKMEKQEADRKKREAPEVAAPPTEEPKAKRTRGPNKANGESATPVTIDPTGLPPQMGEAVTGFLIALSRLLNGAADRISQPQNPAVEVPGGFAPAAPPEEAPKAPRKRGLGKA